MINSETPVIFETGGGDGDYNDDGSNETDDDKDSVLVQMMMFWCVLIAQMRSCQQKLWWNYATILNVMMRNGGEVYLNHLFCILSNKM